jgi:hypothetical protein
MRDGTWRLCFLPTGSWISSVEEVQRIVTYRRPFGAVIISRGICEPVMRKNRIFPFFYMIS